MPNPIVSGSGWVFQIEQENGDWVDCWSCGRKLNDDYAIYSNHDGYAFCSEACILADHDNGETLHAFEATEPYDEDWIPICKICGDTDTGLMHNNTERNVEPLLYNFDTDVITCFECDNPHTLYRANGKDYCSTCYHQLP